MSQSELLRTAPYGAFELKRCYQGNMLKGLTTSCMIVLLAFALIELAQAMQTKPPSESIVVEYQIDTVDIWRSNPIDPPQPRISTEQIRSKLPSVGEPIPMPDEQIVDDIDYITSDELESLLADLSNEGFPATDEFVIRGSVESMFPEPTEFIPFDVAPEVAHIEPPKYPELAREGGWEAEVILLLYVTKEGNVAKVVVQKPSGINIGFDEAAVEAAYKCMFRPAQQNGTNVGVWVRFPFEFRLE